MAAGPDHPDATSDAASLPTAATQLAPGVSAPRGAVALPRSSLPPASVARDEAADYVIRGELGRGGMAVVLLAEQRSLGREVAIKRLTDPRADAEALLLHEATITGQLEHPNIVPVHAIVSDAAGPAVVLKRVAGVAWEELLRRGDVTLERHVEILVQVCNAVAFAHSRGVVHLDVKPSNVMIGDFGEVVLMDWGIARRTTDAAEGAVLGTPCYMSPEQTEGRFGVASDVFLLGACLFEVLTGRPPYPLHDALAALDEARRCAPLTFPEGLPEELTELCLRACAKEVDARLSSVVALRDGLLAYRDRRAARQLLERADQSAREMRRALSESPRSPRSATAVQAHFSGARVAYEQALASFPESLEGTTGLGSLVEDMVAFELAGGHDDAALALLPAHPAPDPAWLARVKREAEVVAASRNRLSALERDVDLRVGAASRVRAFRTFGAAVLIMVAVLGLGRIVRPHEDPSPRRLAIIGTLVFVLMLGAVGLWALRGRLNQANRSIAVVCLGMLAASMLHRWSAVVLGQHPASVLVGDAFLLASGGLALALFHRAGVALAVLALGVALAGTAWPSAVDDLFTAASIAVPVVAFALQRRSKA